ncbi:hypothetical protein ACTXT7_008041 [Hymenolepis weldensis]
MKTTTKREKYQGWQSCAVRTGKYIAFEGTLHNFLSTPKLVNETSHPRHIGEICDQEIDLIQLVKKAPDLRLSGAADLYDVFGKIH